MARMFRNRFWLWLPVLVIPIWLWLAVGEVLDARQLEQHAVTTTGEIVSARWIRSRSGYNVEMEVRWTHAGSEVRHPFRLGTGKAEAYVSTDSRILQPSIEVRYVPEKPTLAALAIDPPDPWWVSAILAGFGLCVVTGVVLYLMRYGFWVKR